MHSGMAGVTYLCDRGTGTKDDRRGGGGRSWLGKEVLALQHGVEQLAVQQMQIHVVLSHLVAKICQVEKQNKQIIKLTVEASEELKKQGQDGKEQRNDLETDCCTERDATTKNKDLEEEEAGKQP